MQWEIKSVLPPRRRATQTGGKKMSPQSSRERFFILQQSSVLVHLIRHFFTNTKCILFSVQIQHAMSFFIEVKFFPIHIRLRFATITLLIGCNLKNLGAIKKEFSCLYFSNRKVLSAGNKNVDAR